MGKTYVKYLICGKTVGEAAADILKKHKGKALKRSDIIVKLKEKDVRSGYYVLDPVESGRLLSRHLSILQKRGVPIEKCGGGYYKWVGEDEPDQKKDEETVPFRNPEHYPDPTAYKALNSLEKETTFFAPPEPPKIVERYSIWLATDSDGKKSFFFVMYHNGICAKGYKLRPVADKETSTYVICKRGITRFEVDPENILSKPLKYLTNNVTEEFTVYDWKLIDVRKVLSDRLGIVPEVKIVEKEVPVKVEKVVEKEKDSLDAVAKIIDLEQELNVAYACIDIYRSVLQAQGLLLRDDE